MDKLRQEIKRCAVAPSHISDIDLCFEVLSGGIDWKVPSLLIPMNSIPKRMCWIGLIDAAEMMTNNMRESSCEQGLYPRIAMILLTVIKVYGDLAPRETKIMVHPVMTFRGTDKTTDYAIVVLSAVSFQVSIP